MFDEFDITIWKELLTSKNYVAAHLFTATPQTGIKENSIIYNLFNASGVEKVSTSIGASWREEKLEPKKRRDLLSSLYYLEGVGSAAILDG